MDRLLFNQFKSEKSLKEILKIVNSRIKSLSGDKEDSFSQFYFKIILSAKLKIMEELNLPDNEIEKFYTENKFMPEICVMFADRLIENRNYNRAIEVLRESDNQNKEIREKLKEEGYSCTLANARFVKPFDKELVERLAKNHRLIVTMEENVLQGGFGLPVTAYIHEHYPQVKVLNIALPDAYVEHGNVSVLREGLGIDSDSIIRKLKTEGWL